MNEDSSLRAGIVGLGMAGNMILRTMSTTSGVRIVAAADLREHALGAFREQFGGRTYPSIERLAADPDVEAVWVATGTQLHREHAVQLCEAGKHVIVEKPMAVTLQECDEMIAAAQRNQVVLLAGGVRSFEPAFQAMRHLIDSGRLGRLAALQDWSFTNWMNRAREPHEVDVNRGGGAVYNQAAHGLDTLRMLGGGMVRSVRGATVDTGLPGRPCPGYFSAFMEFENDIPATFTYNGYGYINSWEMVPWGETAARQRAAEASYAYRRALRNGTAEENEAREFLRFGGRPGGGASGSEDAGWTPADAGLIIATCERGEVRQSAHGLYVYDDEGRHDEPVTSGGVSMRQNEVDELRAAIRGEREPLHDGRWGKATLEVLLGIIESSRAHRELTLKHQVPVR